MKILTSLSVVALLVAFTTGAKAQSTIITRADRDISALNSAPYTVTAVGDTDQISLTSNAYVHLSLADLPASGAHILAVSLTGYLSPAAPAFQRVPIEVSGVVAQFNNGDTTFPPGTTTPLHVDLTAAFIGGEIHGSGEDGSALVSWFQSRYNAGSTDIDLMFASGQTFGLKSVRSGFPFEAQITWDQIPETGIGALLLLASPLLLLRNWFGVRRRT